MIDIIIAVLTVFEALIALLLIGIILIQQSKAGGGLGAMGGGMTETVFGASAGNVLTKATVVLASIFLGITLLLTVITGYRRPARSVVDIVPEEAVTRAPAASESASESPATDSATAAADSGAAGPDASAMQEAPPPATAPAPAAAAE